MHRKARPLIALAAAAIFIGVIRAEDSTPPESAKTKQAEAASVRALDVESELISGSAKIEPLTLNQAIQMALQNNLDSRVEEINVDIASGRVKMSWGAFDPVLTLSAGRQSTLFPQNPTDISTASQVEQQQTLLAQQQNLLNQEQVLIVQEQVIKAAAAAAGSTFPVVIPQIPTLVTTSSNQAPLIYDSQSWNAGADLKGKTPFGTTLDLSINVSRNEHNFVSQNLVFFPDNIAFAGVSVDQPLLRDFGYDANLADVRINRKNKQIAKLTWQLKVIDAIQNVMGTYYDMFYALENLRVKQEAVDASHKLVEANQRRLDLGLMAPIDLRQAQVGESIAQEELVTAKNIFMERQFALKRTVLKETNTSDERVFVPADKVLVVVPKLDRIAMMQEAFQNRLEYKNALHAAEVEDIRLRFARNQVLPKIDLVATYGLNGLAGGIGKSVDAAFGGQAPQWSVGVVATIPLGNVQNRAQLGIAKNLKEQAILRIKQTELAISIDVDTLISRIQSRQQSVETARQSRRLAEEAVTIDRRRLEEGQVSSFDVVETQKKLYDARAREIAAQAELDKSVVQLWVATGTLLQKKSITLGD